MRLIYGPVPSWRLGRSLGGKLALQMMFVEANWMKRRPADGGPSKKRRGGDKR